MSEQTIFGPLTIAHDERVLEPRAWTVAQSEWAAAIAAEAPEGPVLELCAGAGQIGLLAAALSGRRLVCVDANPVACDFARANAVSAGLADRTEVREGFFDSVLDAGELFPVVIADPPWVPSAETSRYPEDPLLAIDGGSDGLDVARACLAVIDDHLAPGGAAVLQLGTRAQAEVLEREPCVTSGRLVLTEVRQQVRGVLVRLDRR